MSHATQPRGAALQQATTIAGLILVFLITRLFTVVTLKLESVSFVLNDISYYGAYLFQLVEQGNRNVMG